MTVPSHGAIEDHGDGRNKDPFDWSPDGTLLLYRRQGDGAWSDLWLMPLDGSGPPRPLAATAFNESFGNFSPDGRSVVYVSNESGQNEIYVISVDGGGKVQVSASGGTHPRWRRDGREIVYLRARQDAHERGRDRPSPSSRTGRLCCDQRTKHLAPGRRMRSGSV